MPVPLQIRQSPVPPQMMHRLPPIPWHREQLPVPLQLKQSFQTKPSFQPPCPLQRVQCPLPLHLLHGSRPVPLQ